MRIAHLSTIHQALDVRIFEKECRTLAAQGHDVHFVVHLPPENSPKSSIEQKEGVTFWPIESEPSMPKLQQVWARYASVWKRAMQLKADVYHFHDTELIVLGLFLKLKGFRVVYDVHEDAPKEAISLNKNRPLFGRIKFLVWHVLEWLAKRFLDGFVCVTPTIAAKFPAEKTVLVRNFPLLDELVTSAVDEAIAYPQRDNLAIYAGGITKIRGITEMVDALAKISPTYNARLLLLGSFSPAALEQEAREKDGWQSVDFLGWRSRQNVIEAMGRSRMGLVTLHPEQIYQEALPVKLFEYMSAGLPVIASDFPLWRSLIQEIGCGLLVDPLDPIDIANAITYLLTHPEEAEAMGKRGQAAVRKTYNWQAEAQTLLDLYHSLDSRSSQLVTSDSKGGLQ